MHTIAQPWMWAAFLLFVLAMLLVDLLAAGGRKAQRMTPKQAAAWSVFWICLALLFAWALHLLLQSQGRADLAQDTVTDFLAGYLIEKSLSIDNIFVFLMIFNQFGVPPQYQRRVLLYGVLGAIVLRLVMIMAGIWVVEQFSWVLYVFGVFLIYTGFKMTRGSDQPSDLHSNPMVRYAKKYLPFTDAFHAEKFSVVQNGKRMFTPLLLVLIVIEVSDVLFAVDSIPAIFAVTTDPFIVFTSNVFAIMGLRALYFLLADMSERFHYLKYGLALVLMFVGAKMLLAELWHVPTSMSLLVIAVLVSGAILASWLSSGPARRG